MELFENIMDSKKNERYQTTDPRNFKKPKQGTYTHIHTSNHSKLLLTKTKTLKETRERKDQLHKRNTLFYRLLVRNYAII